LFRQWDRGGIHTNAIENFWSLFKRRVVGSFHQISIKHLQRYISEFCWRFNNRENEQIFIIVIAQLLYGTPMPYARLTAGPSAKVTRNASAARQNRKRGRPREDSHF
jgi:ISXO2-like transposase domain